MHRVTVWHFLFSPFLSFKQAAGLYYKVIIDCRFWNTPYQSKNNLLCFWHYFIWEKL